MVPDFSRELPDHSRAPAIFPRAAPASAWPTRAAHHRHEQQPGQLAGPPVPAGGDHDEPPSWGYDLAGGEAARFIELSGQMASREQARIEQDEAEQALRSLGMTPSAENRLQAALGRIADGT